MRTKLFILGTLISLIDLLTCNVWRDHLLPFRKVTSVQVLDLAGIGEDGFLFEMSDETMAGFGGDEVGDEEGVEEYALSAQNHDFHEPEFSN